MRPLIAALIIAAAVAAKPARPIEQKKVDPIPDLAGQSGWGTVTQDGRRISITGHSHWEATGEIRPDGKTVFLQWTLNEDGRVAPSVYRIEGKQLVGEWGWLAEVQILANGSIVGDVRADTFGFGAKAAPPDF